MLKTRPVGIEEIVFFCGQPAGWKTMVQLEVWIGAGGAAAECVVVEAIIGRLLSGTGDEVAKKDDIVEEDNVAVADDAPV